MAQVSRTPKSQRKNSLQNLSMSLRKIRTLLNRAPTAGALRDIAPLACHLETRSATPHACTRCETQNRQVQLLRANFTAGAVSS